MKAELRHIDPDNFKSWDEFAAAERDEPWDNFGWFTLSIGPQGDPGSEYFGVLVSTAAAVPRAKGDRGAFRGIIVGSFEPESVAKALHDYVDSITGPTWSDIVRQLRAHMSWEYEGMAGT